MRSKPLFRTWLFLFQTLRTTASTRRRSPASQQLFQRESSQPSWKQKHVSESTKTLQLLFASINIYMENCLKLSLDYVLESNHLKHSNFSQETSPKHKCETALLDLQKGPSSTSCLSTHLLRKATMVRGTSGEQEVRGCCRILRGYLSRRVMDPISYPPSEET